MRLQEWEGTIQKILSQCRQTPKQTDKALVEWRAALEKEPTSLEPFQIDEIVREVRQRLGKIAP